MLLTLFFALSSSLSFELEAGVAKTHANALMGNAYKQTARYLFLDDTQGDLKSLVSGISFSEPYNRALHDLSLLHHGQFEVEGFLSFGKEFIEESVWTSRASCVIKGGFANQGSASLFSSCSFQKAFKETHFLQATCDAERGVKKKDLIPPIFMGMGILLTD